MYQRPTVRPNILLLPESADRAALSVRQPHYQTVHHRRHKASKESIVATPRAGEAGVNEAFAKRVGAQVDNALFCIERARRIAEVCGAAVGSLDVESSADIASMVGNELFVAIDEARKAREGKACTLPSHRDRARPTSATGSRFGTSQICCGHIPGRLRHYCGPSRAFRGRRRAGLAPAFLLVAPNHFPMHACSLRNRYAAEATCSSNFT